MRPLSEQVVVVTGASSGIGRATAALVADRGGRVVAAARSQEALNSLAEAIKGRGEQCLVVPTDVAVWEQVSALADRAVEHFGGIDTWVNVAAVSVYGLLEDLTVAEIERVIDVDLLGVIYGTKAALRHVAASGGAIINVSSVAGERPLPLQAPYSAAKAAIKAFDDALRLELARSGGDVTVTTILPASINTPFFTHARSKTDAMAAPLPPVYDPQVVAESIVFAAEHPRRDIYVGGAAKLLALQQRLSPALVDWLLLHVGQVFARQQADQPPGGDSLFQPSGAPGDVRGQFRSALTTSHYTRHLEHHPRRRRLLLAASLLAAVAIRRRVRRRSPHKPQPR